MRFFVLLAALACVPLAVAVHACFFTLWQKPALEKYVEKQLTSLGILNPLVTADYLDLEVSGEAATPQIFEEAENWLTSAATPFRLVRNHGFIPAALQAERRNNSLILTGWLANEDQRRQIISACATLRQDLVIQADAIQIHPKVCLPESSGQPLTLQNPWVASVLAEHKRKPWVEISRRQGQFTLAGLIPESNMGWRTMFLKTAFFQDLEDSKLEIHPHVDEAIWLTKPDWLSMLESFFGLPGDRTFRVDESGKPHLEGTATPLLAKKWEEWCLSLSGSVAAFDLRLVPSVWHFPDRTLESRMPEESLRAARYALEGLRIHFESASDRLSQEDRSRLAALTSSLVAFGPELKLVIGGHPTSEHEAEIKLAQRRGSAVHEFLMEQGLPSTDVIVTAFDAMPVDEKENGVESSYVEILVR